MQQKKNLNIIIKNKENTSFPEQTIYFYISQIFEDTINTHKFKYDNNNYEIDVFIPSLNLCIEYDGGFFHSSTKAITKDELKNEILADLCVKLIRIREEGCPKINMFNHLCLETSRNRNFSRLDSAVSLIFCFIMDNYNLTQDKITNITSLKINSRKDQIKIVCNYMCKKTEKSLANMNPTLAKEWHPTKNGTLTPNQVFCGTNIKVWWLCSKNPEHEWPAVVNSRNSGVGCPFCNNNKVCIDNCLATTNPELAKEWHPTKNGDLTAHDVFPNSGIEVWWMCDKNKLHEWPAIINNKSNGRGCPFCHNKKVDIATCLATLNPDLAKEWHPTKNGNLTPYNVSAWSHITVWWLCSKGHEWKSPVYYRNNPNRNNGKGTKCGYCRKEEQLRKHTIYN